MQTSAGSTQKPTGGIRSVGRLKGGGAKPSELRAVYYLPLRHYTKSATNTRENNTVDVKRAELVLEIRVSNK